MILSLMVFQLVWPYGLPVMLPGVSGQPFLQLLVVELFLSFFQKGYHNVKKNSFLL